MQLLARLGLMTHWPRDSQILDVVNGTDSELDMPISNMVKQLAAVAFTVQLLWSAAGVAAADPTPAPPSPATGKSGPSNISSKSVPSNTAAAAIFFTCTINAQNPHNSGHQPGTINVQAVTSCTPAGATITMVVTLWKRDVPPPGVPPLPDIPENSTPPVVGANYVQANTAIPCSPGTYYGAADAVTVFPLGAIPPGGTIGSSSAAVPITCD